LGNEAGLTLNYIPVSQGEDHITDSIIFQSGSTNIGIGTTVPTAKLDILSSSAGSTANILRLKNASNDTSTGLRVKWDFQSVEGAYLDVTTNSGGSKAMTLYLSAANATPAQVLTIDGSNKSSVFAGNVGIGTTPSAWTSGWTVLQVGTSALQNVGAFSQLSNNIYYDGTNYRYINTSGATRIGMNTDGEFFIGSAVSGTAGNVATMVTRLSIAGSTGTATFSTTENQGGLYVTSATDNTTIRVASTATNGQEWRLQSTGGSSGLGQGKLIIKVGGTETASHIPLTLTTDNSTNGGRVGIGTTTDAFGNVYLAGYTQSTTSIASGGHQNTFGGSTDAFLVKFNTGGVRQWGTYYGGNGFDQGFSTVTDGLGNVFLAGRTNSTNDIAWGGYQSAFGGGAMEDQPSTQAAG
jgi:hypothetical protein